jgi:hypothetical protein
MLQIPDKQKHGRRGDHWRRSKRRDTPYLKGYGTPFGEAAKELEINSDKRLAAMLGNRVVPGTIRQWRNGTRKTPFWAILGLAEECDRRSNAIHRATNWLARAKKEAAEAAS